jgi:N-acetyltransferase
MDHRMTDVWPPDTTLERNGIRLEPLSLAHEAGLRDAAADGELWNLRVTSVPEPDKVRTYIQAALASRAEGSRMAFAIIDTNTNTALGSTSYHDIVASLKRVEIGYTWYRKSVQRSHVNTTCKLMLMQHAFDTLQCPVVGWRTDILNFASQRAIEKLGARRDGAIRHHALRRDATVRDTVMYSMTADEWPEKKAKLETRLLQKGSIKDGPHRNSVVSLAEVTKENLLPILRMNPGAIGERMVATNGVSLAQAAHNPNAWPRAVMADATPVGFVMLLDPTIDPDAARADKEKLDALYVWRLMIDFKYQSMGFGEQVMRLVIERAKSMPNIHQVTLSYAMRDGNAKAFYERCGFRDTGDIDDGEMGMTLKIR